MLRALRRGLHVRHTGPQRIRADSKVEQVNIVSASGPRLREPVAAKALVVGILRYLQARLWVVCQGSDQPGHLN
jgi:hypothetical protein